jgi:hypothetical protein
MLPAIMNAALPNFSSPERSRYRTNTYRAARGGLARASTASSIEAVGALWANSNSSLLLVTAIVTAASAKP